MDKLNFAIGSEVLCEGESCGRLAKVVVDPHTRRVTDLVVQKGRLLRRDSIVPIAAVKEATTESVSLAIGREQLGELSGYRPRDYVAAIESDTVKRKRSEEVLQRVGPADLFYPEVLLPAVRLRAEAPKQATNTVTIERGHRVQGRDGVVGRVDHVLIDRESGIIRLLVVDRGPLSDGLILPMALVTSVEGDTVMCALGEEELDSLYRYRARDDVDIMVELKARISGVLDAESIEMHLNGGILRLAGMVADVRTKRRVEAAARSVLGVLDVQNDLDTGTALQARVTEALARDRRTALSDIQVVAGVGVVTLRGQVDAQEIREAAAEVASSQDGVRAVDNELVIVRDDETALLRLGMLSECGVSFGESLAQALREPVAGTSFPVELSEANDVVTVKATLLGVAPDDVDVQVAGNTLTLTVVAGDDPDNRRPYCRSIVLPSTVDAEGIKAQLMNGLLTLHIPKTASPRPHKVSVSVPDTL